MSIDTEAVVNQAIRKIRYDDYLRSPRWALVRQEKLARSDYTCEACGYCPVLALEVIPLDVHHVTYENFGNEAMSDLQVLCRNCHQDAHGRTF